MNISTCYKFLFIVFLINILFLNKKIYSQESINDFNLNTCKENIIQLKHIYDTQGQLLNQIQQQVFNNQDDIDCLRGQIQENQYKINQILEQQKQILLKINNLNSNNNNNLQANSIKQDKISNNIKIYNDNNDIRDYHLAVTLAQDKLRQKEAIKLFQSFLIKYPNSNYQPNAHYWLGQLNYINGIKDEAKYHFAYIIKNFNNSSKASEAMYKLGLIVQSQGDLIKAKSFYRATMEKYPDTDGALKAKKQLILIESSN